jgi:hypothetical protein
VRFDHNGSIQWGAANKFFFVVQYFSGLTELLVTMYCICGGFKHVSGVKAKIAKEWYRTQDNGFYHRSKSENERRKSNDESGIRTHASEETRSLVWRLRPLGHLAFKGVSGIKFLGLATALLPVGTFLRRRLEAFLALGITIDSCIGFGGQRRSSIARVLQQMTFV